MKDTIAYFIDLEMQNERNLIQFDLQLKSKADQLTSPNIIENVCVC